MSGTLMLGWKWPSHPLHLLILFLLLAGQVTSAIYVDQKCYCVEDEDETVRQAITTFPDNPLLSKYEYLGARYNSTGEDFYPCVCSDVVGIVTEMAVTQPYVLELAAENVDELNSNVTKAMDGVANTVFSSHVALKHSYHSSFATYKETKDSKAIFTVEFIVKGSDINVKDEVSSIMVEAMSGGMLDGVGTVDNFTMEFAWRVCPDEPGAGPDKTEVSPTNNVAGTTVTYTCETGYRTNPGEARVATSLCLHDSLTWTPPSPAITCVEDKRCHLPPPRLLNTNIRWNGKIEEGTEIIYSCRRGYKTLTDQSSTYRCEGKNWTLVSPEIKCDPPRCGDPPQVPDHGVMIHTARDEITYQCDTYAIRSGVNFEHKILCRNSTWDELPETFNCIGSDTYDGYQEWENFLNITLPVSTVLAFIVILCLLCTRADSPVCNICKRNVKEVF